MGERREVAVDDEDIEKKIMMFQLSLTIVIQKVLTLKLKKKMEQEL